jgi:hypothetical protein
MNDDIEFWMRDLDCLQAFAEKHESLFGDFLLEYCKDLEDDNADSENDLRKEDEYGE